MGSFSYKKSHYWLCGGVGCLATGAGLCGCIEAAFVKHSTQPQDWILYGTVALVVFMAGICLLIGGQKYSTHDSSK